MGWFGEQIRLRKLNDDQVFADALQQAAGAIMGQKRPYISDDRVLTGSALEKILRYYRLHYKEAPETVKTLEGQLEHVLQPQGMLYRKVQLEDNWYKRAVGAYLGFRAEDGSPLALIPSGLTGYRCYDPAAGESFAVTAGTRDKIKKEAYCFYRPLPQKKISIPMLVRYLLGSLYVSDFVMIAGATLGATCIGFLTPKLINLLYGPVLTKGNVSVLAAIASFMICAGVSKLVITAARDLISGCVETRMQLNVESAAMMRVLSLPPDFFREYSSGELSSRMQSINTLCSSLVNAVLTTGMTSVISLLYITQIFRYAPVLLVPSLIIILLTVGFSALTMVLEMKRQKKSMEQNAKTTGLSFALINGIQKIRLAGAEKRTFAKWAEQYNKTAELMYNPPMFLKVSNVINQGIQLIGTIVLYAIALSGAVAMKDYLSFNSAYGMVMGAFTSLISIALVFARIKPVLYMAQPILDAQPETGEKKKVLSSLKGNIELDSVSFRYSKDGPLIVDNLSLRIRRGEYVAVVGPSGCGKSTLIRLLLGFEQPERGSIFYDGKNISQIDVKSLRRRIGTVMQNSGLFNDSIYANIALSCDSLTLDEAWEAAETACIAEDIREMPMGMHTVVSEGQGNISGGQKQRLMIARAVAPKPAILIFDEATSALDNITQKKVTEALDKLECTRIVIAHRLSTIRSCSRILYLSEGRVLEEGTYEELMAKNGLFEAMVARQQL